MPKPANDLLNIVERMTPEDCIELSEILQVLSEMPRDAKWTAMFQHIRQSNHANG